LHDKEGHHANPERGVKINAPFPQAREGNCARKRTVEVGNSFFFAHWSRRKSPRRPSLWLGRGHKGHAIDGQLFVRTRHRSGNRAVRVITVSIHLKPPEIFSTAAYPIEHCYFPVLKTLGLAAR
jgi:hypothetical protein